MGLANAIAVFIRPADLRQQGLGLFLVKAVAAVQARVVAQEGLGEEGTGHRLTAPKEDARANRFAVDGPGNGLAHSLVVERRLRGVHIEGHEQCLFVAIEFELAPWGNVSISFMCRQGT